MSKTRVYTVSENCCFRDIADADEHDDIGPWFEVVARCKADKLALALEKYVCPKCEGSKHFLDRKCLNFDSCKALKDYKGE